MKYIVRNGLGALIDKVTGEPYKKAIKDLDAGDRYEQRDMQTGENHTFEVQEKIIDENGMLFVRVFRL